MAQQALVTVSTDGFRDYVDLPDGRQINLGSVSVLKLVTALVRGSYNCRRALDSFLKHKQAVISVDLVALQELLKPKRARWAAYDDPFIQIVSMQPGRGASMDPEKAQSESIPSGDGDNHAFYSKLTSLESNLAKIEGCGCATEADVTAFHTIASDLFMEVTGSSLTAAVDKDVLEDLDLFMENTGSLDAQKMTIIRNLKGKIEKGTYDAHQAPRSWMHWIDAGVRAYVNEFSITDQRSMFPMDLRKALSERLATRYESAIKNGDFGEVNMKTASSVKTSAGEGQVSGPAEEVAKDTKVDNPYAGKDQSSNDTYYKLGTEGDLGDKPVSGTAEEVAKGTKVDNPYAGKDQSKNETYYKLAASEIPFINECIADSVMSRIESTLRTVEASAKRGTDTARKDLGIIASRLSTLIKESNLEDPSLSVALRKLSGMVDHIQNHFST